MKVVKRNGKTENVSFDKITKRIKFLLYGGLSNDIDPVIVAKKVINMVVDGITTAELDNQAAEICIAMITTHPSYGILASRICNSNHQKNTRNSFMETMNFINDKLPELFSEEFYKNSQKYGEKIDEYIKHARDFNIDYFGFKTLYKSYLICVDKVRVERIQHMWMRVALCIHGDNLDKVFETYDLLSRPPQPFITLGLNAHNCPVVFYWPLKRIRWPVFMKL